MRYIIDGYNLFFFLQKEEVELQRGREKVLKLLKKIKNGKKEAITIVFDAHKKGSFQEERSHLFGIETIYTRQGETADEYIVEMVAANKKPASLTVVTSDKGLALSCRSYKAKTMTIKEFLKFKDRMYPGEEKKPSRETEENIKRLIKEFSKN